jgi:hypothetical protein
MDITNNPTHPHSVQAPGIKGQEHKLQAPIRSGDRNRRELFSLPIFLLISCSTAQLFCAAAQLIGRTEKSSF